MTALMGGSGPGKTSLISALCRRAFYGKITGDIKINGHDTTIEENTHFVGFVQRKGEKTKSIRNMIKVAEILTSNKERDPLKKFQLLVDQDPCVVNTLNNDGFLPVHLFIKQFSDLIKGYENITEYLTSYLNAKPKLTSDYLTGLQKLPDNCCVCRQSTIR